MDQYKRLGSYPIMIFISLISTFIVLEASVRILKIAPRIDEQYSGFKSDDLLPFIPQPNSTNSCRSASDEYSYHYEHNIYGFRDNDYKPFMHNDKEFIIMGLGDSFTYGIGAEFNKTYLYLLEQSLNSTIGSHKKIRIIKAGIPRYYLYTERLLFEKYSDVFKPDLVIVGFVPNDIIDTYYGLSNIGIEKDSGYLISADAEKLGAAGIYLYRNFHFFRIIARFYYEYSLSKKNKPIYSEIFKANGFHEKEWKEIEKEYKKIIHIANALGAKTAFVHIPQKARWNEQHFYISYRFKKFVSENGAYFIDTLPKFIEESKSKTLYYDIDGHCTPDGYGVIANAIHDYLIDNKLVP